MPTQKQWDLHWIEIAEVTSKLSKDPTTKVGCVIVTPDNRQCAIGYNGFPAGIQETPEKWERPLKYQFVIHSEINAIMNCPFDTKGCTIYITLQPCHRCIGALKNAGIKRIVYKNDYPNLEHKDIWEEISKLFDSVEKI